MFHRIHLGHKYGRHFIVMRHQYDHHFIVLRHQYGGKLENPESGILIIN